MGRAGTGGEAPRYVVEPIGRVASPLTDRKAAPMQGFGGSPRAWLVLESAWAEGIRGIEEDAELFVLTWLHQAGRDVLVVHPRGDPTAPETGVFSTRSPDRPNPIGLHRVRVITVEDGRILVDDLEAIDGTPIVDIKPVIGGDR